MIKIAMTGASGNMGRETLVKLFELDSVELIRVLLLEQRREKSLFKKWKKRYGDRLEVICGNLNDTDNCEKLVDGVDYVLNLAAVIPPKADYRFDLADECNNLGVKKLVKAIESAEKQPKFIHISTVGIYGHRNEKHPWGRVGDPLIPSAYDVYSVTKIQGERAVLESGIDNWAVLRQTGMLHANLMADNISDGLIFHTCYNVPIEWVTAHDSALLISNMIKKDAEEGLPDFWRRVYNIGGGKSTRITGYETFDEGFSIIGVNTESFMKPNWNATRNFHCMWFFDSDILNDMFDFRTESSKEFWQGVAEAHKYFKLAKILPPRMISYLVLGRLMNNKNSPAHWARCGQEGRVIAAFGSYESYRSLPKKWKDARIFCKGVMPDGSGADYLRIRDKDYALSRGYLLDHGYDESKPLSELDIDDVRQAAEFRGGRLLSESMLKGGVYEKLKWADADGNEFELSAFSVLCAGHWGRERGYKDVWDYDRQARTNPFIAQVYYDSHGKDECYEYYFEGNEPMYNEVEL